MNYQDYGVTEAMFDAHAKSLCEHIGYVQEAGKKLGVLEHQLMIHDQSKWSVEEFPGYAKHFPDRSDPDGFAVAWLHHIHHNPHHWQHWIFPDGYMSKSNSAEGSVIEMPQKYALEMVADWMGSSRAYTGFWDMSKWLSDNIPKIKVHSNTADYLSGVLDNLGYADVVYTREFARGLK